MSAKAITPYREKPGLQAKWQEVGSFRGQQAPDGPPLEAVCVLQGEVCTSVSLCVSP